MDKEQASRNVLEVQRANGLWRSMSRRSQYANGRNEMAVETIVEVGAGMYRGMKKG